MVRRWLGRVRQHLAWAVAFRHGVVRARGVLGPGYYPLHPGLLDVPGLHEVPCQASLLELLLREWPQTAAPPRCVLEIECGLGAGLLYAHAAFPEARLLGVGSHAAALRQAWMRLAAVPWVELRQTRGDATRLPPHSVDLIFNLGAPAPVGPTELLRESARILAPGGVVALVAELPLQPDEVTVLYHAAALQAGLALRGVVEISDGCLAALDYDRRWAEAALRRVPLPWRRAAAEFLAAPGSARYRAMASGQLRSYAILVDHPVAQWEAPVLPPA